MATATRQSKPYPDFPLTFHPTGRWCKKIKGKQYYFGRNADEALKLYLDQRDDLHAGRTPRVTKDALTVGDLFNRFLVARRAMVTSGELTVRSWAGYRDTSKLAIENLGRNRAVTDLGPADFAGLRAALAEGRALKTLALHVTRIRAVLRWAFDHELVPSAIRTSPDFTAPSKVVLRLDRKKKGLRMYSREDILTILESAEPLMRAVVLLGINCAYGPSDCAKLPMSAIDVEGGWVQYARGKTGIDRKAKLWPETVNAIREWLARRPKPVPSCADRLFVGRWGQSLCQDGKLPDVGDDDNQHVAYSNYIAVKYTALIKRLGLGGTFYDLRRTFRTVADESLDAVACDKIMGHVDGSMGATYRQRVADARLERVADHVRLWLWPAPKLAEGTAVA